MSDCVEWTGTIQSDGYGIVWVKERQHSTHASRFVMAEAVGWDAIEGKTVNHHCDNPLCVNLEHLYVGTQSDNLRDAYRRGRRRRPVAKGEHNQMAKMTEGKVRLIRDLYDEGMGQAMIADLFGLTQSAVSMIVHRKRWAHVA